MKFFNSTLLILLLLSALFSCRNNQKRTSHAEENVHEEVEWYAPEDPTPREQCPCCDYVTLPERGNYLICPICFWEDDGQDIDELDVISGPNHSTLREGRLNFQKYGACDPDMIKFVIPIEDRTTYKHIPRDP